jgi:inositol 2-dehydrogenase
MTKQLRVGVIGLGRLGNLYARYFLGRISKASLAAVSDVNQAVADSFSAAYGVSKSYSDYHDLLNDQEIDAVVIVTPTSLHKEISIASAEAGKAVFCEKPLSISLAESMAIKQAVDRAGIFFHLGFMRRFDKGYAAARKKIDEGVIGEPIVFKSTSRDPFRPSLEYLDPNHSGGLLTDCGIHDFDLARWLVGEIDRVHSIGGVLAYPEIKPVGDVDNAIASLSFKSNAIGIVDLSRSGVYGYDIRTEILGTRGTLQIGYLRETPLFILTKEGVTHDTVPYFMERFGEAYIDQLQNFVDSILQDKPPSITCDDGIAALRVSLAATRSLHEARTVALSEILEAKA